MFEKEKKQIIEISKTLKYLGIMPGASGNISVRKGGRILITPSGIDKSKLRLNQFSVIDINGKILNNIKPSSEWQLHAHIYRTRKDVNAIIHTHPPYTITASITNMKIDRNITAEFNLVVGNIAFTEYRKPGTKEIAEAAAKASLKSNVIVLKNHGLVCLSKDLNTAQILTEEVEQFFKINYLKLLIS